MATDAVPLPSSRSCAGLPKGCQPVGSAPAARPAPASGRESPAVTQTGLFAFPHGKWRTPAQANSAAPGVEGLQLCNWQPGQGDPEGWVSGAVSGNLYLKNRSVFLFMSYI